MARLWTCGFELQSVTAGTAGHEYDTSYGAESISTAIKHSGAASLRINPTASDVGFDKQFGTASDDVFIRFYLRIASAPTQANTVLFGTFDTANGGLHVVYLNTDSTITLYMYNGSALVNKGTSSALDVDTWYRIEFDSHTSTTTWTASLRVDGIEVASGTETGPGAWDTDGIYIEAYTLNPTTFAAGTTTCDIYIDDVAVNDDSGSFQTSWPGEGNTVYYFPNGNGDNSDWVGNDGNSTDNYLLVDDVTPDNATTYVTSNTSGDIDDYATSDSTASIGTGDTINVVEVHARFIVSNGTNPDPTFVTRIKAASAGTVEESGSITASNTAWRTDSVGAPRMLSTIRLYDLPGASTTAWAKSDLDTMQIGVRETLTDTHFVWVTQIYAVVDYTVSGTEYTQSISDTFSLSITTPTSSVYIAHERSDSDAFSFSEDSLTSAGKRKIEYVSLNDTALHITSGPVIDRDHIMTLVDAFAYNLEGGGGATYTQSLSDSFAFTVSQTKTVGKVRVETITLVESLTKALGTQLTSLLVLSESSRHEVGKNLSALLSLAETSARFSGFAATLTESISFSESKLLSAGYANAILTVLTVSDVIGNTIGLSTTESLSITESIFSSLGVIISKTDSIAFAEALARGIGANKSAALTFTETFSRAFGANRALIDTVGLSISISKTMGLSFAKAFSIVDEISTTFGISRTFSENVSLVDSIVKATGLSKTEALSIAEDISLLFQASKSFTETLSLTDALVKSVGLRYTEALSIAESMTSEQGAGKAFTESVTLAETLQKSTGKTLSESESLADVIMTTFVATRRFDESFTLADAIMKSVGLNKTAAVALADAFMANTGSEKSFDDSFSLTAAVSKDIGLSKTSQLQLFEFIAKAQSMLFSDTTSFAESLYKSIGLSTIATVGLDDQTALGVSPSLQETLQFTDQKTSNLGKVLESILSLSDSSTRTYAAIREFSETLQLLDTIKKSVGLNFDETVSLLEVAAKTIEFYRQNSENLSLQDSFSRVVGFNRALIETVGITELLTLHSQLSFSEVLTIIENIGTRISHVTFLSLTEQLALAETISKETGKTRAEVLSVLETLSKGVGRSNSDSISLFEALVKNIDKTLTPADLTLSEQLSESTGVGFSVQTPLSITESLTKTVGLRETDSIVFADLFRKEATKQNVDSITFTDSRSLDVLLRKTDSFNITEASTIGTGSERRLDDMITLADAIRKSIELKSSEVLVITEGRVFDRHFSVAEELSIHELLTTQKAYFVDIFDEESLVDSISMGRAADFQDYLVLTDDMSFVQTEPFRGKITIHTDASRTHLQNKDITARLFSSNAKTILGKTTKKVLLPSKQGKTLLFFKDR